MSAQVQAVGNFVDPLPPTSRAPGLKSFFCDSTKAQKKTLPQDLHKVEFHCRSPLQWIFQEQCAGPACSGVYILQTVSGTPPRSPSAPNISMQKVKTPFSKTVTDTKLAASLARVAHWSPRTLCFDLWGHSAAL
ncbi:unnamed protein product [Symbiodinium natans]|uniref:Uncharacterized protein n=1 Tax=Symbiodinium natans TaxID=878477 RepID=A0A812UHH6_9DINO|nr:unnamed protein product [Symbiodinium natans]